jgi:phosphoglycolate phosphatase-like HAD superfamily hydrolase
LGYCALVLFDIDGTLVRRAGPHHKLAMIEAVRRVTGLNAGFDGIPLYGMLDPDIIGQMMRNAGATRAEVRLAMPEIVRRAQAIYVRSCPASLARRTCPGVRRLLARLRCDGALMGLVTGNLTRIGWKKMEGAGLREFFRFGAFGEMAPTRGALAKLAIARARREHWISRAAPVSLVGDAPADIIAARQSGARSVAVATGVVPAEQLRAYSPDLLLEDLRALRPEMLL